MKKKAQKKKKRRKEKKREKREKHKERQKNTGKQKVNQKLGTVQLCEPHHLSDLGEFQEQRVKSRVGEMRKIYTQKSRIEKRKLRTLLEIMNKTTRGWHITTKNRRR